MKNKTSFTKSALVMIFLLMLSVGPVATQPSSARAQDQPADNGNGQPEANRKKFGFPKKLLAHSSSGIAKADFNGDGFADLAIGVPHEDTPAGTGNSGAVNVIYGSAQGLTVTSSSVVPVPRFLSQNADDNGTNVPGVSEAGDLFGWALAGGDFNGDGFSDLAIGIPGENITSNNQAFHDAGRVVIIYGSPHGLEINASNVTGDKHPAAQTFDLSNLSGQLQAGAKLGFALSWGDFNGDGVGDLAIGAPFFTVSGQAGAGAVWVLMGSRTAGLTTSGSFFFNFTSINAGSANPVTAKAGDNFGMALAAGNFDGDKNNDIILPDGTRAGIFDLAIGVPGRDAVGVPDGGDVVILFGSTTNGLRSNRSMAFPTPPNATALTQARFGQTLAVGDFDADGKSDLAVAAPQDTSAGNKGTVAIFYGSSTAPFLAAPAATMNPKERTGVFSLGKDAGNGEGELGFALAAGDFNGDGATDLAMGAPFASVSFNGSVVNEAGEVDVVYGAVAGIVGASHAGLGTAFHLPQTITQASPNIPDNPIPNAFFGRSLSAWNFGRNETITGKSGQTADLAIGVPGATVSGHPGAGMAIVIYGSVASDGLVSSTAEKWSQASSSLLGGPENSDGFAESLY